MNKLNYLLAGLVLSGSVMAKDVAIFSCELTQGEAIHLTRNKEVYTLTVDNTDRTNPPLVISGKVGSLEYSKVLINKGTSYYASVFVPNGEWEYELTTMQERTFFPDMNVNIYRNGKLIAEYNCDEGGYNSMDDISSLHGMVHSN